MEIGYLIVLYIRLGVNFRNLYIKDSSLFYKRLIKVLIILINKI